VYCSLPDFALVLAASQTRTRTHLRHVTAARNLSDPRTNSCTRSRGFAQHQRLLMRAQACSWVYDEREDSWPTSTTEFCLVTPRSDACAAAINGKLYVAGAQPLPCVSRKVPLSTCMRCCRQLTIRRCSVICPHSRTVCDAPQLLCAVR
jgi:hypothetical protein